MNKLMLIVAVLIVGFLVTPASATDYYIDPVSGDDGDTGLTEALAWATLAYADGQLSAGDTLYFMDGTWTNQHFVMGASGTAENHIVLAKNTGASPIFDGNDYSDTGGYAIDTAGYDYWDISGLYIEDYKYGLVVNTNSDYIVADDMEYNHNYVSGVFFYGCSYVTISDSVFDNNRWNQIQFSGTSPAVTYVTISGNTIQNSDTHNGIDLYKNFNNITIHDNLITDASKDVQAIYVHGTAINGYYDCGYVTISDNTIYGYKYAIQADDPFHDSIITNNTMYDCLSTGGGTYIRLQDDGAIEMTNMTVTDNDIWGDAYDFQIQLLINESVFDNNNITAGAGDVEFRILANSNDIEIKDTFPTGVAFYEVRQDTVDVDIIYDAGHVFTCAGYTPAYTNAGSKITLTGGTATDEIYPYRFSILPEAAKSVTSVSMNSDTGDYWNVSATGSDASTALTITSLMDNATHTYELLADDVQKDTDVADADGLAEFTYTIGNSAEVLEVKWLSGAGSPDTLFQYWDGSWKDEPADYFIYHDDVWWWHNLHPNYLQTSGQPTLKITNNGTAAGTPYMWLDDEPPATVDIWVDNDNIKNGDTITLGWGEANKTAVHTELAAGANVTLWNWIGVYGYDGDFIFNVTAEVQ